MERCHTEVTVLCWFEKPVYCPALHLHGFRVIFQVLTQFCIFTGLEPDYEISTFTQTHSIHN